jgi:hypothetical protein
MPDEALFLITLSDIRPKHPDWTVGLNPNAPGYLAVSRPTQTSEHIIATPTIEELAQRLDEADRKR